MSESKAPVNILSYDLKASQVLEAMAVADAIGDSLMIWGPPGIGKSALALQYANTHYPLRSKSQEKLDQLFRRAQNEDDPMVTMADFDKFNSLLLDQDTNFIDFRLSQIEPSDLRGIPIPVKAYFAKDGRVIMESELADNPGYTEQVGVVWASPQILQLPEDWEGVIIFDEINSAMPIVQAASYQLILDRRVGELVLPKKALVLAAGNRETDGGVTFSLATPLRDRMTHVEMIPDYNDWIENFAIPNRVNATTIAFIKETGAKWFNTLSPKDTSHAGGASPRSWTRVADIEDHRLSTDISSTVYKAMVAGRVGTRAGIEYTTYVEQMADLPSVRDILSGAITSFGKHKEEISKNYFITLSLTQAIIELADFRQRGQLEVEQWGTYCSNFLTFIDTNFAETQKELIVHAIRAITDANVIITYSEVPVFRDFVKNYGELLRKARSMK